MPKKCCVANCNGNYNKDNKVTVFRLPTDKDEREKWIQAIPRENIPDKADTVVCEQHFPPGYPTIIKHGKKRPREPPSVFKCVKPSLVPTKPAPCRPTSRASSSIRSVIPDEMEKFIEADKIDNFQHLNSKLNNKLLEFGEIEVIWYSLSSSLVI